jgi:gliding-associated putative ABC transporter substrate-binding component GldG
MSNELEQNSEQLHEENQQEETEEFTVDERLEKSQKKTESRRQQAIIRTLLVLGIIVFINIIAIYLFFRIDLTKNKIYTLSDASRQVVGNLEDKLVIKSYFTDNLPAPYNNTRRYLQEILDDYRNYSKGNMNYEIISPSDETKLEEEAQKYGIPPVQLQTYKDDRAEAIKAYVGLVILYGGKQETIPFLGNIQNLEYEITGAIRRLTQSQLKKVGILSGQDIPGVDKISKVNQYLSKYYNVTPIDASKNNPIPNDVAVLIVFTPKSQTPNMMMQQTKPPTAIPENIKFAIDQYIMNGGKVIFMMSRVAVSTQQQYQIAQILGSGLEDMLEGYGIKMGNRILKDKECAFVSVPMSQGPIQMYTQVPFPWYPRITNVNKDLPAFSGIGQIFLSFTTEIDTSSAQSKGIKITPIITTSNKTGADGEFSFINITGQMLPDSIFKYSNLNVGSIFSGQFTSFYSGKPVPADTATGASAPIQPSQVKTQSPPDTKLIAIGNGDFALDEFRGPDENLIFFSNLIDFMADDIGLSEIKLKDANPKPLKTLEDSSKKLIKYGLLAVPPVIVLIIGLVMWRRRKALTS